MRASSVGQDLDHDVGQVASLGQESELRGGNFAVAYELMHHTFTEYGRNLEGPLFREAALALVANGYTAANTFGAVTRPEGLDDGTGVGLMPPTASASVTSELDEGLPLRLVCHAVDIEQVTHVAEVEPGPLAGLNAGDLGGVPIEPSGHVVASQSGLRTQAAKLGRQALMADGGTAVRAGRQTNTLQILTQCNSHGVCYAV